MPDHKIYITRLSNNAQVPVRHYPGDAGFDLFCSADIVIPPRSFTDIPTGVAIAMPAEIWGRITSRSSTVRGWGLHVQEGIIDTEFRDELFMGVWNHGDDPVSVPEGTRLGQLIFHLHVGSIEWQEVKKLPAGRRGPAGFGSTGL